MIFAAVAVSGLLTTSVAAQKPFITLSGFNDDKCSGSSPQMIMTYKSGQCYTVTDVCKISKIADDKCNNLKDAQGNKLQMSLRYTCTDKGTIKGAFYNGTTCSGDTLQMDLGEFKDNDCQLGARMTCSDTEQGTIINPVATTPSAAGLQMLKAASLSVISILGSLLFF